MGVKIWVNWDREYERYYITDYITYNGAGPIEISNELYERFMEHERQYEVDQNLMASLEYDWENPVD